MTWLLTAPLCELLLTLAFALIAVAFALIWALCVRIRRLQHAVQTQARIVEWWINKNAGPERGPGGRDP